MSATWKLVPTKIDVTRPPFDPLGNRVKFSMQCPDGHEIDVYAIGRDIESAHCSACDRAYRVPMWAS